MKYSFDFTKIQKCDVILLDRNSANLKFKNCNYIYLGIKKINIICLIKSILFFFFQKKKFLTINKFYKQNFYRMYQAKIAIGHSLDSRIAEIKILCPEIKTIVYQVIYYTKRDEVRSYDELKSVLQISDFVLIYSKEELSFLKRLKIKLDKRIMIAGSVKANEKLLIENKKKKYDIMFISQFIEKTSKFPYLQNDKICLDDKYKNYINYTQNFVLEILAEYCKKNNKKLTVAFRNMREGSEVDRRFLFAEELKSLKKYLRDPMIELDEIVTFVKKNSWDLAMESKIIVTLFSNLGLELNVHKRNILFLPLRPKKPHKGVNDNFKSNYFNKNLNIVDEYNKKTIFKKIDAMLKSNRKNSLGQLKSNKKSHIKYDENNQKLKKLVSALLLNKKIRFKNEI